jgi:hypothetical protein
MVGGISAADAALLMNTGILDAWALTAARGKLAMAGLVVGVGALAYEATRAGLEITGLDTAITSFFENAISKAGDGPEALGRLNDSLGLIDRTVSKLNAKGIDLGVDPKMIDEAGKAIALLQEKVSKGIRVEVTGSALFGALDQTAAGLKEVTALSNQFGVVFSDAWKKTADGAQTLEQHLERVKALLAGTKAPALTTGGGPDPDAIAKVTAATKDFEKAMTSAGLTSRVMITEAVDRSPSRA